jgi:hypothetical protein
MRGCCERGWTEADRIRAIDRARSFAGAPFDGIAGFHIDALGCKRINLPKTARRRERVRGKPEAEKTYTDLVLGLPYQAAAEVPEWQRLHERREPYRMGTAPAGVVALTAGADVRRDRIEVDVWGRGPNRERRLVDHVVIDGRPERQETWQALGVPARLPQLRLGILPPVDRRHPGVDGRAPHVLIIPLSIKEMRYCWRNRTGCQRQPACRAIRSGIGRDQAGFGPRGRVPEAKRLPVRCPLSASPANSPNSIPPLMVRVWGAST